MSRVPCDCRFPLPPFPLLPPVKPIESLRFQLSTFQPFSFFFVPIREIRAIRGKLRCLGSGPQFFLPRITRIPALWFQVSPSGFPVFRFRPPFDTPFHWNCLNFDEYPDLTHHD